MREKNIWKRKENDENRLYDTLASKHQELLHEKELEREKELREKIEKEKRTRDEQLKEEKRRKRLNERDEFEQEQAIVSWLKDEMNQERMI